MILFDASNFPFRLEYDRFPMKMEGLKTFIRTDMYPSGPKESRYSFDGDHTTVDFKTYCGGFLEYPSVRSELYHFT